MAYKIILDKEECIGCGACVAQCDNFEMENKKAFVKKTEVEDMGCNKTAEEICPVNAIRVDKK